MNPEIDTKECKQKILRLLQRNARMAEKEIAERLDVPEERVSALIKQMEDDHIIVGYGTFINDENMDNRLVRAIIEVEVAPQRDSGFDRVAGRISKFNEVRTVSLLSGSYDLSLEVVGKTLQDVAMFVSGKLSQIEGVRATRTHFLLKKYKEGGFIRHEEEEYERLKIAP